MLTPTKKTIALADGREISIETGRLAKQADGAVELRFGNTMLLATVCSAKEAEEGADFMPLQVEYKEKYSSVGRYPGGFTKREGRPSDNEILTARLVDRVLRPLFPSNYHANTIVNVILFSSDGVDQPDAFAGLAASAAIAVSDVPFEEPIAEVRVARINGEFVIDPTFEQAKDADIELMVGATYDNIMMVEGEMDECSEDELIAALKAAHEAIKPLCLMQKELAQELGVVKRDTATRPTTRRYTSACARKFTPSAMPWPRPATPTSNGATTASRRPLTTSWRPSPRRSARRRPR